MARFCELSTPLGADLEFSSMRVSERLSRLFEIDVEAVSIKDDLDPKKVLGHRANIKVDHGDGVVRHFDGFVTQFANGGSIGRRFVYRLQVRPALWFLTRTTDCRVFQNLSVPQVLDKILLEGRNRNITLAKRLLDASKYKAWEYCVQYRETDFAFASRLMEQEGIYYFFEHTASGHTLVLTDDKSKHTPIPAPDTFDFVPGSRDQVHKKDVVTEWRQIQEVQPAMFTLKDYDWLKPASQQMVTRSPENVHEHGQASAKYEIFDYPGDFDPVGGQALAQGDPYVAARAEELASNAIIIRGDGLLRTFHVGRRFKLANHTRRDQNGEYLIVGTEYVYQDSALESGTQSGARFKCSFTALPQRQQFRAPRVTRRPLIHGLQTAVVTGPSAEEIFTDKYGRIKVQFHWDRRGLKNEESSCFLRVSSLAAGNNWGFISIPRIGQEVLVSFLEGDPDRPVVTGVVYNANNMPPWALPDNKTQWGMLSRSTKDGTAATANALRFEDKKGAEQVWLHAEKNQLIEVENDEVHTVGHDRSKTIGNDEITHVKRDRTETVDRNETITVKGDRTEKVEKNEKIDITGDRTETVGGKETVTITGKRTLSVKNAEAIDVSTTSDSKIGTAYSLTAGTEIKLTTGAASITMKVDGTIEIKGVQIKINGVKIDVAGAALIDIKAPLVKINS